MGLIMIEVVIVDDSALIRNLLREIIDSQPDMKVTGLANDPIEAREVIRQVNPDVITLDVEMPKMHGLDFLDKLMRLRPTPVVMISTLTTMGSDTTIRALELGAIDFVAKPKVGVVSELKTYTEEICGKIRTAASAGPRLAKVRKQSKKALASPVKEIHFKPRALQKYIAIGSSTGGTEAIKSFLMPLPETTPPIVITQHMPPGFTRTFAERMDDACRLTVKEAEEGDVLKPGCAYIAPGDRHMKVVRCSRGLKIELDNGPLVNRHKPSVEVLFDSTLPFAKDFVGVILTGMGADGAEGLKRMREAGARTLGQDENSCVVYGMPKAAAKIGAVEFVESLQNMPAKIAEIMNA